MEIKIVPSLTFSLRIPLYLFLLYFSLSHSDSPLQEREENSTKEILSMTFLGRERRRKIVK